MNALLAPVSCGYCAGPLVFVNGAGGESERVAVVRSPQSATCTSPGCDSPSHAKSLCSVHYSRWRRNGDPNVRYRFYGDDEARLWAHVDKTDSCWFWTGLLNHAGYGRVWNDGAVRLAHRVAYELVVGPIPSGLTLDHLCRTRRCVNPTHLEPVTQRENTRRGNTISNRNAAKTHCVNGHPFDDKNTARTQGGHRRCRRCHADSESRRRAALRARERVAA